MLESSVCFSKNQGAAPGAADASPLEIKTPLQVPSLGAAASDGIKSFAPCSDWSPRPVTHYRERLHGPAHRRPWMVSNI